MVSWTSTVEKLEDCSITIRECHGELEEAATPDCLVLARNAALPDFQIQNTLSTPLRLGEEAERMVLAPLLARTMTCG